MTIKMTSIGTGFLRFDYFPLSQEAVNPFRILRIREGKHTVDAYYVGVCDRENNGLLECV